MLRERFAKSEHVLLHVAYGKIPLSQPEINAARLELEEFMRQFSIWNKNKLSNEEEFSNANCEKKKISTGTFGCVTISKVIKLKVNNIEYK